MTFRLDGRVALVTGGSRGIGRAACVALARAGAHVVVNFVSNEAAAAATVTAIEEAGGKGRGEVSRFDVASSAEVDAGFKRLVAAHGRLDVLVNNAGITADALLLRQKDEDWDRVLATNLRGAMACSRAAIKTMMRARWGRIVNVSSVVGESGNAGQAAYASAKAGLLGLTKTLAKEYASRNVTVNAVTPGYIETDMTSGLTADLRAEMVRQTPLGRVGTPEDVAGAVVFLASEEASYVTGQVLRVNGGMYL